MGLIFIKYLWFVIPFLTILLISPVEARFDYQVEFSSRLVSLSADTGTARRASSSFDGARLDLRGFGRLEGDLEFFAELQLEAAADPAGRLSQLFVQQLDLLPGVDLRIGRFILNYGEQFTRRTDNASGRANYLIGNQLVDPAVRQSGLELSGSLERLGWSLALTDGQASPDFQEGQSFAVSGKLWKRLLPRLAGSISYYRVDHDSPVLTNFTDNSNAAEIYQQIDEQLVVDPLTAEPDVTAWQVDLIYDPVVGQLPLEFYGQLGRMDLPDEQLDYRSLEIVCSFLPELWLAARGGRLDLQSGRVDRLQLAAGYRFGPHSLFKLEYLHQDSNYSNRAYQLEGVTGEISVSW